MSRNDNRYGGKPPGGIRMTKPALSWWNAWRCRAAERVLKMVASNATGHEVETLALLVVDGAVKATFWRVISAALFVVLLLTLNGCVSSRQETPPAPTPSTWRDGNVVEDCGRYL